MLRAARPASEGAVARLLARGVATGRPEIGWDEARLLRIIARLSRWDARVALGLAGALGRPAPRTFVDEAEGRIRGAVAWSPGHSAGWVAALSVDPQAGDTGTLARLLDRCMAETRRHRLGALLVPGALLPERAGSHDPLASLGFVPLGLHRSYVLEGSGFPSGSSSTSGVRPFRRRDAERLARFARAGRSPKLEVVEPVHASDLLVSASLARALGSSTAAFVHEGAGGVDALVRATRNRATPTAHLSMVLDPLSPGSSGVGVLRRALAWSSDRGALRAITEVPEEAWHLGAALRQAGFEPAEARVTWARAVDGADAP